MVFFDIMMCCDSLVIFILCFLFSVCKMLKIFSMEDIELGCLFRFVLVIYYFIVSVL